MAGRNEQPRLRAAGLACATGRAHAAPRINLIIYHGVLAPNARVRAAAVTFGTPAAATPALAAGGCSGGVYVTYGLHVVFDNIRLPYTAVGFRYDINHSPPRSLHTSRSATQSWFGRSFLGDDLGARHI
jgi:hypothetical protein